MTGYYTLNKNVYIVDGKISSCIYDLSKGKLYHIDNETTKFIRRLINKGKFDFVNEEESDLFDNLIKNELIIHVDHLVKEKSIFELKEDVKPSFAWLEITHRCNLRCTFCYEESDCTKNEIMNMNDFETARDFLIKYGIKKIQFIGGEPMLHPNLKEMIESCIGKFDFIEVYTNGTHLNQEWCDFFKNNNINIAISLHSYIPEEHDKVTQVKGSYNRVMEGIKLIIKNKIPYRIAAVGNKNVNVGKKPKDLEFNLRVGHPRMVGRCDLSQMNFEMFKERAIQKSTFEGPLYKDTVIRSISGHQCFSKNLYIAYNLEVFPCVMERRISHGKIKNGNNTRFLKKAIFCYYNKDYIKTCKDCEFRYACFDCRPDALGKKIKDKPWYCSFNPNTGEWKDLKVMFDDLNKKNQISK